MSLFSVISAQKPADFSGTWVMDLGKSDASYGKFYSQMTCLIKQTPPAITIEKTATDKNGKKSSQEPVVYTLDGKETAKEQYGGIDKYSSVWSADKKKLTLKYVRTANGSDFGSKESYSLSPDAKVLTVSITDLKGGSQITEVYTKK
ncbi:MAG TPA: hypothetical protein VK207_12610 [Bacteroidales bacterium]|nr:hypothetical protein [Bacteroidales bacterium]